LLEVIDSLWGYLIEAKMAYSDIRCSPLQANETETKLFLFEAFFFENLNKRMAIKLESTKVSQQFSQFCTKPLIH
jgi:hypothetical protein